MTTSAPTTDSVFTSEPLVEAAPSSGVVTPSAPVTTPPVDIPERPPVDATGAELRQLRAQVAQANAREQERLLESHLNEQAQRIYREALARGIDEDHAQWITQQQTALAREVMQERAALRQQQSYIQGRANAATHFGNLYGVEPGQLLMATSVPQMEEMAKTASYTKRLESRLKALEQKQVPAQNFNPSNGSTAGGGSATSDNIDGLWMDYEIQHPGQPNPYEAAYRKMVYR